MGNNRMRCRAAAGILAASMLTLQAAGVWAAEEAGEGYFEVSCDKYTLHVPESLRDVCEIVAEGDTISFYEPVSRESFGGGFAGGISLYENLADYGNIPQYERGGEIDYPDGSKLDIVWQYPSDVQFDPQDETSTSNYEAIREALPLIAEEVYPSDDGVFVRQEDIDTTGIYDEILEKLAADLTEKKDRDGLLADSFSDVYAYAYDLEDKDPLEAVGYAFTDINRDGYSELVIGSVGDYRIYDMYVPVDGEPVHFLTSGERNMYSLSSRDAADLPSIRLDSSNGAAHSEVSFWSMEANQPEPFRQMGFLYDGETDPDNPYYFVYGEEDPEPTTEDEWNERMTDFGEPFDPALAPLASR